MFVIKRLDGKFVAAPGQKHSYTSSLQKAQRFHSRALAIENLCPENERVIPLEEAFLFPLQ